MHTYCNLPSIFIQICNFMGICFPQAHGSNGRLRLLLYEFPSAACSNSLLR